MMNYSMGGLFMYLSMLVVWAIPFILIYLGFRFVQTQQEMARALGEIARALDNKGREP